MVAALVAHARVRPDSECRYDDLCWVVLHPSVSSTSTQPERRELLMAQLNISQHLIHVPSDTVSSILAAGIAM